MKITDIKTKVDGHISADNTLTLRYQDNDLNSPDIDAVINAYFAGTLTGMIQKVNGETAIIENEQVIYRLSLNAQNFSLYQNDTDIAAQLSFFIKDDVLQFIIETTMPSTYNLADSFRTLKNQPTLPINQVKLEDCFMTLQSEETNSIGFEANLQAVGPLETVAWMVIGDLKLTGTIHFEAADNKQIPIINLQANILNPLSFGIFTLDLIVRLRSDVQLLPNNEPAYLFLSQVEIVTEFITSTLKIPVVMPLYGEGQYLVSLYLDLSKPQPTIKNLNDLSGFTNGTDPKQLLNPELSIGQATLSLDSLSVVLDPYGKELVSLQIGVGLALNWTVITNALELEKIGAVFTISDPAQPKIENISAYLFAKLKVGTAYLDASVLLPDMILEAHLEHGSEIDVNEVIDTFAKGVHLPGNDQLSIYQLDVFAQVKAGEEAYSLEADTYGRLTIIEGFVIDNIYFFIAYENHALSNITLSSTFAFTHIQVELFLLATYQNENGWYFEGNTGSGQTIPIGLFIQDLVNWFGEVNLPAPLQGLVIENLAISFNTTTKDFLFTCQAQFPIGSHPEDKLAITVTIDLKNNNGTYNKKFGGHLEITVAELETPLTFDIRFAQDSTSTAFMAVYTHSGGAQGLNIANLIKSIVHTDTDWIKLIPESLEIDLKDVYFVYIKDTPATETASQQSRFLFGFNIGLNLTLTDLPFVGHYLGPMSFLRLESAFVMVASAPFVPADLATFQLQNLPALREFQVQLSPGVVMGAVIDFQASAANSKIASNIQQLLVVDRLLMDVTLSTNINDIALMVELGDLVLFKDKLRISAARMIFKASPLSSSIAGSLDFKIPDLPTIETTGRLTINEENVEALFNIEAENQRKIKWPMGLQGIYLMDIGVELGIDLVKEEVTAGLLGKFWIGKGQPPAGQTGSVGGRALDELPPYNEFALIFGIDEALIPDPDLLFLRYAEIPLVALIEDILALTSVPDPFKYVKALELMLYWCDDPAGVQLPDGSWAYAGLGFNASLDILGFSAYANLQISYSTVPFPSFMGKASMSPIKISDKGRSIVELTGAGEGTPKDYVHTDKLIPTDGPTIAISTIGSPYLDISMNVKIFSTAFNEAVKAEVTNQGFAFIVQNSIGGAFSSDFDCVLSNWTHFQMCFKVKLDVDVKFDLLRGVDLGTIHLDSDFDAKLAVDVSSSFRLTLDGTFVCEGDTYQIPTLKANTPFSSLDEIPYAISKHIQQEAKTIFKAAWDEADDFLDKYGHDIEKFADKIIHGLTHLFVHRHHDNLPHWMTDDQLVKGSGVNIYRMHNLKRRLIPDPVTLVCIAGNKSPHVEQIEDLTLNTIPTKEPPYPSRADNVLLRAQGEDKIYVMKACRRYHISDPSTFELMGYRWEDVRDIAGEDLKDIPEGNTITIKEGSLIRGSAPAIYRLQNNHKRLIPNMNTFNCMGFKPKEIQILSDDALNLIPSGSPIPTRVDGTLIRPTGGSAVYVMSKCKRQLIPDLVTFEVSGYKWEAVKQTAPQDLNEIPNGDELKSLVQNDLLLKSSSSPAFYLIEKNLRRLIPDVETFICMGLNGNNVKTVSNNALKSISQGAPLPSRKNNTLLRAQGENKVYVMIACRRCHVADTDTFDLMGYQWDNVQDIAGDDLKRIPEGKAITLKEGALIRGSGVNIYVIQKNQKRLIPDPVTLDCAYKGKNIQVLPDEVLNILSTGQPLPSRTDGTLLKAVGNAAVYVISECKCHLIPDLVTFELSGFKWEAVKELVEKDLDDIGKKGDLKSLVKNGLLLRTSSSPAFYLIEKNLRRLIPDVETFICMRLNGDDVKTVSENALNSIPLGAPLPSRKDNTLLRAQGDKKVYVMLACYRCHITDPDIFNLKGYQWDKVQDIARYDLENIPEGKKIKK